MITNGYGLTIMAADWVNILQYAQVALRHGVAYAWMVLAGIIAISGIRRVVISTIKGMGGNDFIAKID